VSDSSISEADATGDSRGDFSADFGADSRGPRRVLMLAHTGREEAREVAKAFCKALIGHGIVVRMLADEARDLGLASGQSDPALELAADEAEAAVDCELALVIGGDGTILRAAEVTHASGTPVLGVNLGHVGFLAEAEYDDVESTIDAIVHRRYSSEDRLTLDVSVFRDGEVVFTTFALNEASVEKAARQRMLEVVVEIDGRPLSRFGCDGVVCATPTGSTAYNFSAGGPIVWPEVEALLMVPISAHALFARPMVVAPTSVLAVEVLARTEGAGVLWCDGRRAVDLPPGARIEVRRGVRPVRLVRLHQAPFTDRLVAKFGLPVEGWRGSSERRRRLAEGKDA
jgi:NAD+ kinase